jgi:hypothetical protein
MDLLQIPARMEQFVNGLSESMRTGAEAGFKQEVPNATPDQLKKVDAIADSVSKDFPLQEMVDAVVLIYQKHLTRSDLQAILAFYSSPVGQKLLKEQPAMMTEGMQAGQQVMMKRLPEINERIKTQMAQLVEQEHRKSAPSKDSDTH